MKLREIGYRGKTAVIAGTGAVMLGSSELVRINDEKTNLVETVNWFGKAGLFWAGVRIANIGVGKMSEMIANDNEAKWANVLGHLPDLKDPVSPLRINLAVSKRLSGSSYPTGLATAFSTISSVHRHKFQEGSYVATMALANDVEGIIDQMADAVKDRTAEHDDRRYLAAHNAAWLLDEVAPISDNCTKTPQTDDTGKYWYDYIQHQAFDRAGLLFETQQA